MNKIYSSIIVFRPSLPHKSLLSFACIEMRIFLLIMPHGLRLEILDERISPKE